ncbi:hypothetical protein [Lactobacillus hominis]|nr:hypothetical protein [Lactobacillus hominis]MCT3348900.1 hypothetical protein [Lactobacillus hominis]
MGSINRSIDHLWDDFRLDLVSSVRFMKIKSVKYKKGEWYYVMEDDSLVKIEYEEKKDGKPRTNK